jgi:hypothetical protein
MPGCGKADAARMDGLKTTKGSTWQSVLGLQRHHTCSGHHADFKSEKECNKRALEKESILEHSVQIQTVERNLTGKSGPVLVYEEGGTADSGVSIQTLWRAFYMAS